MSDHLMIYHNPDCSKSNCVLEMLQQRGEEVQVINYLQTPPDRVALEALLAALGLPASALIRKGEPRFAGLFGADMPSEEMCLDALVRFPELIQRPIVLKQGRAIIGRPPERVLELFDRI